MVSSSANSTRREAKGLEKGTFDNIGKWSDRAKEELQSIQSHLGPFMEKLAALSEEYELEKVHLEKEMFQKLKDEQREVSKKIVEIASTKRQYVDTRDVKKIVEIVSTKRQYVDTVNESHGLMEDWVRDSLQVGPGLGFKF
ncbi:hypothetical protein T484DRAFT_1833337 [Baffinella frigidus]|nr:hypothetical protein T484DRAFT_1833337 [Cryptophyta sp. CCMP2293]